jgi:hypothetical protein
VSYQVYKVKDSGERQQFDTGAQRDTQDGKPRYDLIPPQPLKRLAEHYGAGAAKYDDHNWTKGIPSSRFLASATRHLEQLRLGDQDEDHAAAVIFNIMGIMFNQDTAMDDLFNWSGAREGLGSATTEATQELQAAPEPIPMGPALDVNGTVDEAIDHHWPPLPPRTVHVERTEVARKVQVPDIEGRDLPLKGYGGDPLAALLVEEQQLAAKMQKQLGDAEATSTKLNAVKDKILDRHPVL